MRDRAHCPAATSSEPRLILMLADVAYAGPDDAERARLTAERPSPIPAMSLSIEVVVFPLFYWNIRKSNVHFTLRLILVELS